MEGEQFKAVLSKLKKIIKPLIYLAIAVLIAVLVIFIIKKVRAFPNTILSFAPASKIVGPSQNFTLDAMVDPKTNQLTAIEVYVTFNQAKFRLDSINTTGSPFTQTLRAASINNTNGTASIIVGIPLNNPPTPVTAVSKVATFSFHSLAAALNSPIAFTTASQAAALGEGPINVITDLIPSQVTVDVVAPTGGFITYANGYQKTTTVTLAVNDGADAVSGVNTASRKVQRRSAPLSGTTCGTYGDWGVLSVSGTYPNFSDTTPVNGNCYQYAYLVSDNVGNQATYTGASTVRIDTVAPALAQVTAVLSPTNDTTPDYTFSSSEAGTIVYGGACSSATTAAASGNNTITFNTLSSSTHSNCTIRVTDAAGNQSSVLSVNTFTVDAVAPTIISVTSTKANGTYGVGAVLDIVVTFSEAVTSAGSVTVALDTGRSCTFTISNLTTKSCDYTVQTEDASADLTTTSISGTISDQVGNTMTNFTPVTNLGANKNLVINAVSPVLGQVTAVAGIASDTTPDYTFSSTKAGTIAYGGDCSSTTTAAVSGNNTVTFNALSMGTHANCAITVTDASNNVSAPLGVNSFVITYRGDLNIDRAVNIFDYNIFVTNFGNTNCGNAADADKNCVVNIFDYNILIEDFGKSA